jgi:hypothetical protein
MSHADISLGAHHPVVFPPETAAVEWESYGWKGDDNVRSFVLKPKNPHGVPPLKFAPRAEWKQNAS